MNATELAYRKTAVQGASGFGLLIALYDTLAGNLRRAADAQRRRDIQKRCQELNHALLVIGYLEEWIDREGGGDLAQKLIHFYSSLRSRILEAQIKQSVEILEQQIELILAIRGTWQDLEVRAFSILDSQPITGAIYPASAHVPYEQVQSSWSA